MSVFIGSNGKVDNADGAQVHYNWANQLSTALTNCTEVWFSDFKPGTRFSIKYIDSDSYVYFVIGASGNYHIKSETPIRAVYYSLQSANQINPNENLEGSVTFKYEAPVSNRFALISDAKQSPTYIRQIQGPYVAKDRDDAYKYFNLFYKLEDHLIKSSQADVELWKTKIWKIFEVRFEKRAVMPLYLDMGVFDPNYNGQENYSINTNRFFMLDRGYNGTRYKYPSFAPPDNQDWFYVDRNLTQPAHTRWVANSDIGRYCPVLNPGFIYKIVPVLNTQNANINEAWYFEYNKTIQPDNSVYSVHTNNIYIDGKTCEMYTEEQYSTKVYIDIGKTDNINAYTFDAWDEKIASLNIQILDVNEASPIIIKEAPPEHDFFTGVGVATTVVYRLRELVYNIESDNTSVKTAKSTYTTSLTQYNTNIKNNGVSTNPSAETVDENRNAFITALDKVLAEWLEENGRL